MIDTILNKSSFSKDDLIYMLKADGEEKTKLFAKASEIRDQYIGKKVYFRGLIELSNRCSKNCLYCGIRAGNSKTTRYNVTKEEVIECAKYAYEERYGSVVIQSGERSDMAFVDEIEDILNEIKTLSNGELGVTLSLGEQSEETYRRWFDAGGHRYLLRIEASNQDLYHKIHPIDKLHDYQARLECLKTLRKVGYQVGTGVMIGLPFQTIDDLAKDLLFIRDSGVVMVGMGPYIAHEDTPLYQYKDALISVEKRMELALKMIAILRLMRPTINIASTTALQTLNDHGRELGLRAGANVIMPNITPVSFKKEYNLYEGKPGLHDEPDEVGETIEKLIISAGCEVGWSEWGDSKFYSAKR